MYVCTYVCTVEFQMCLWSCPRVRYLKTTASNIKLITKFRNKEYDLSQNKDEKLFAFWMEFFIDATNREHSSTQFPVSAKLYMHAVPNTS